MGIVGYVAALRYEVVQNARPQVVGSLESVEWLRVAKVVGIVDATYSRYYSIVPTVELTLAYRK